MELSQASDYARKMMNCRWIKWVHPGSPPAETAAEKRRNADNALLDKRHCADCLNMNGCCFVKGNSPENPLHEHCHCRYEDIGIIDVQAKSVIEKYTKYIFDNEKNKGKKELLEKWGYTFFDADYLKEEIEKQCQLAMQCGEYKLDFLDNYGQRINIMIHLKRKDTGKEVTFVSGWMVYPDGRIVLATPYGDDK